MKTGRKKKCKRNSVLVSTPSKSPLPPQLWMYAACWDGNGDLLIVVTKREFLLHFFSYQFSSSLENIRSIIYNFVDDFCPAQYFDLVKATCGLRHPIHCTVCCFFFFFLLHLFAFTDQPPKKYVGLTFNCLTFPNVCNAAKLLPVFSSWAEWWFFPG